MTQPTAGCHGRYSAHAVALEFSKGQHRIVIRKRLQRYEVPGTARFLTFSCFQRIRLFDDDAIKSEFVRRLEAIATETSVDVLAWVVMPEHVHLVTFSDITTVEVFLKRLKGPFSQWAVRRWTNTNDPILNRIQTRDGFRFWQAGGGYDRNVVGDELLEKIRYCHANAVTRHLASRSVDWPWSSARRYEGRADAIGPLIAFNRLPRGTRSVT